MHPLPRKGPGKLLYRERREHFINPQISMEENGSPQWHCGYFSKVLSLKKSRPIPVHKRGYTEILKLRSKPKTLTFFGIC